MKEHSPKQILTGRGFYTVLALSLVAVAALGWFLLFDRRDAATGAVVEPPAQEVVGDAPEAESPVVETVQPALIPQEVPDVAMPEAPVDDTPVIAEAPRLVVSPLSGEVVAAFSVDELVYSKTLEDWRTHDGMDIAATQGTTVLAACSGTVLSVADDPLMGTTVVLSHNGGYQTTYANLQAKPTVSKGDAVSAGQIIGAVGLTSSAESAEGPHLHFSVTKDGDVVDPESFLKD